MFAGRGLGLVWTVAIIHQLGIGDYGRYAMAFALATLIAVPIDNYFFVGSVRSGDEEFRHDRSTRLLIGCVLFAVGFTAYRSHFIIALGIVMAGAEIAYNAFQSGWMRSGRPDRLNINGAARQAASIGLALPYLYLSDHPTIEKTCLAYVAPYIVVMALAAFKCRLDSPQLPRDRARAGILLADAVCIAIYEQADVLFLGLLTNQKIAGYYSTAAVSASAAAAIGSSYAQTFHEKLRAADGHAKAGPPPKQSMLLSIGIGSIMALVGIGLAAYGTSPQLWASFLIMSVFTSLRFIKHTLTIVLIVQRRDRARVAAMTACIVVKTILIVILLGIGAIGAATAAVATELILVIWYARLVYPDRSIRRSAIAALQGKSGVGK